MKPVNPYLQHHQAMIRGGLVWIGFIGALSYVTTHTSKHGQTSFWAWLILAASVLLASRISIGLPALRWRRWVGAALLVGSIIFAGSMLERQLAREESQRHAVDIALNTYEAGNHLLEGRNPYAHKAQMWRKIKPGPNVEVQGTQVTMFGQTYAYGYPYYPGMMLAYLPFRIIDAGLQSVRWANFAWILAMMAGGVAWFRLRRERWDDALLLGGMVATLLVAVPTIEKEWLRLAITDIWLGVLAIWAFVLARSERPLATGITMGVMQASKLLPAPLIWLPMLVWFWRRGQAKPFALGLVGASTALMLPFVLWDPVRFTSSTLLFYLTHHAAGDDTAMYFYLSDTVKPWFVLGGYALVGGGLAWLLRQVRSTAGLQTMMATVFTLYCVFIAFSKMAHLNYMWGIYILAVVTLVETIDISENRV